VHGPQSRSGRGGEEKNLCYCRHSDPGSPSPCLATIVIARGEQKCMHFQSEYIKERGHLEDIVVDGRIILQDLKEVPFGEHTNSKVNLRSTFYAHTFTLYRDHIIKADWSPGVMMLSRMRRLLRAMTPLSSHLATLPIRHVYISSSRKLKA
jgi:hypothetical protein